jgi:biopolymer transport protein ExbD
MAARNARNASATFTPTRKLPEPEINITPLVDVVLVLLIIFMVIAPSMQDGVPVELPEASAFDAKKPDHEIEVAMTADGRLHLNDAELTEQELVLAVRAERDQHADAVVVLKADAALPYAKVREVFATLSGAGTKGVSLRVQKRRGGES